MPILERIRKQIGERTSTIRREKQADALAQKIVAQKIRSIERKEMEKQQIRIARERIRIQSNDKIRNLRNRTEPGSFMKLEQVIIGKGFGPRSQNNKRFNPITGKFE